MLERISLKAGPSPGHNGPDFVPSPVTVFVGPNNSGKSLALQEIANVCRGGSEQSMKIVRTVKLKRMGEGEADAYIDRLAAMPSAGEVLQPNYILLQGFGARAQLPRTNLRAALENPDDPNQRPTIGQWMLGPRTISLDGPTRIALVNQQPGGELLGPPQNSFQTLFKDDAKRAEVQRIVHDALGLSFVVDPTSLGSLRVRFSSVPQPAGMERSLTDDAVAFMQAAKPVESLSDGVKAFTGMVIEMVAGQPRVLLIDEPEAFLHPALARRLGQEVAKAAKAEDRHVFVSTHSGAFLMGCIQSGAPVTIVRLTYRDGVATSRILTNDDLMPLMRNPLLRSAGVLEALFFENVVVTESDADRAFYQEVNERLLSARDARGIPNCLFLNAQNKQTLKTIVKPLRALGIPVAAIADIDVLKDGGQVWSSLMESACVPDMLSESLGQMRGRLKDKFVGIKEASGSDMKRDGGIALLPNEERDAAEQFIASLAAYGIFLIPGGELESWLKPLGVPGHGPGWLIGMFTAMGEDPDLPAYVRPAPDDVWAFMGQVSQWLLNPARKGIPDT